MTDTTPHEPVRMTAEESARDLILRLAAVKPGDHDAVLFAILRSFFDVEDVTIERCAKVVDNYANELNKEKYRNPRDVAASVKWTQCISQDIRALKNTEHGED